MSLSAFALLTDAKRQEGLSLLLRMDALDSELIRSAFWWYIETEARWELVFVVEDPSAYYKHPLLSLITVTSLDDFRNQDIATSCTFTGIQNCCLSNHNTGYRRVAAAYIYRCQLT